MVIRETSERPEDIEVEVVKLIETDKRRIVLVASKLLSDSETYQSMI